jgi:hyperosmotically inducible protein
VSIQDEVLAGNIRTALSQDKRVGGQTIAIQVVDGEVFLEGWVDSQEQLDMAVMVTQGVSGVRFVNTDALVVREVLE